jgi:hypothetical protein
MKLKLITIPVCSNDSNKDKEDRVNMTLKGWKIKKIISFNENDFMIKVWCILEG